MNSLLEFIDQILGSMFEFFNSSSLQMFLLVGTGLLTIALLILALTRWGHSRPLWKCVVLSVTAHILLLGYAYGTRLILVDSSQKVAKVNSKEESSSMEVRLVDERGTEKDIVERIESEKMSWNEFGNEQPLPELQPLPRPNIDSEILIQREKPEIAKTVPANRFTPMPKAEPISQALPPVASMPKQPAPIPKVTSPSTLRVLPQKEVAEIPQTSQNFIDEMFARDGEFKAEVVESKNVIALNSTQPNSLRPNSPDHSA